MSVLSLTQSSFSKTKPVSYFAVLWLVLAWASVPELYLVGFLNLFIYKDLFIFIYFIYFWLHQVLVAARGIFRWGAQTLRWGCAGFSLVVPWGFSLL